MRIGFAGLGLMGAPMASHLCRAGSQLTVYNRSAGKTAGLTELGAVVAASPDELFAASDAVVLMLADDSAVDAVLGRGGDAFAKRVGHRLIINMGTHAPAWSATLAGAVTAAGGTFVEAPVSGSRGPAAAGELVAMVAGPVKARARATDIIAPMCGDIVDTGHIPSALTLKLAVNLYLVGSVALLAETTSFAASAELDLEQLVRVIGGGPLGSSVVRTKLANMVGNDFAPQATIRDVLKNARLIAEAATAAGADTPIFGLSHLAFQHAADLGYADQDMAAVLAHYRQV